MNAVARCAAERDGDKTGMPLDCAVSFSTIYRTYSLTVGKENAYNVLKKEEQGNG